jgi:type VI secretion system protein ImpK
MSDSGAIRTGQASLVDLGMPIIKLLGELKPNEADASLRQKMEDLFRDFETRALRSGLGAADIQAAKYALCALVDESILLSELPIKEEWLGRPLQMVYFDDVSAGEEFYNRLDQLRLSRTREAADVLEVYHLCLAFGFKGKHGNPKGAERLKVIIEGLANDIIQARGVKDVRLSPQGEAGDLVAAAARGSWLARQPTWLVPLACLVAVLALWLVCSAITNEGLAGFNAAVKGGGP